MSDRRLEPGAGASGVLSLRLGDSQRAALDEIVQRTGRSRGEVVREALSSFLESEGLHTEPGAA